VEVVDNGLLDNDGAIFDDDAFIVMENDMNTAWNSIDDKRILLTVLGF